MAASRLLPIYLNMVLSQGAALRRQPALGSSLLDHAGWLDTPIKQGDFQSKTQGKLLSVSACQ
jgi:hypothetical protein